MWEAVLLSITPAYTQIKLREKKFVGIQLQKFKDQIDKPLSAILTLNTIAHTVGAIGVGEQAALIWGNTNPYVTKLVVPALMTLAILLLSEIIPKTIGANYWKRFTSFTVYSLTFLIKALLPLVWLCQLVTKFFPGGDGKSYFTRTDFLALAEIGEKHGVFEESEADLIENTLDLHELRVREVMRPVSEMVMLNKTEPLDSINAFLKTHRYTRYPVFDPEKNNIIGIIHIKDFVTHQDITALDKIIRPVLKVSSHLPLKNLLNRFKEGMPHFALVYKENELVGFITLDNVLQVLLGIMKDEFHRTHVDWNVKKDGSIQAKGRCSIFALEQLLDINIDADEDVETLAGLIYKKLERFPQQGEKIVFSDFDIVIEEINASQIVTVLIHPKKEEEES